MFGFSMVQMVRKHARKLNRELRDDLVNLYRPFKWTPCFLHGMFEGFLKKTKKIPVVIEFEDNTELFQSNLLDVNHLANNHFRCKIKKEFHSISCCSADLTPQAIEELVTKNSSIKKIYKDYEVNALLDVATPSVQAYPQDWRGDTPLTGNGKTIAIIDTGIYPHPDIGDRLKVFKDVINNRTDPYDDNGHGTHCAGCAASSSADYFGPAPEANLVGVKVLDKLGSGSLSTIVEGIDWCLEQKEVQIDIISMSLGGTATNNDEPDPLEKAVLRAWEAGIVVVVAAGNSGPDPQTIATPGIVPEVITVGAIDDNGSTDREDDIIADFSSRGPAINGATKPDVVSPGVNIISLRSPNSYLDKLQKGNRVGEYYFVLSGTSMATPICAGVVALLLEYNPNLSPNQVKDLLIQGAELQEDWIGDEGPNTKYVYGNGYINLKKSIAPEQ